MAIKASSVAMLGTISKPSGPRRQTSTRATLEPYRSQKVHAGWHHSLHIVGGRQVPQETTVLSREPRQRWHHLRFSVVASRIFRGSQHSLWQNSTKQFEDRQVFPGEVNNICCRFQHTILGVQQTSPCHATKFRVEFQQTSPFSQQGFPSSFNNVVK